MNSTEHLITTNTPQVIHLKDPGHYRVVLEAEGADVQIRGGWQTKERERVEITVEIVHQARHTRSETVLRGVARDQSHLQLSGTIIVTPDAAHTNAFLTENILLLSPRASAQAVPNLEIETNEVKCSHAATVSSIPEEHLFYLMSRGLQREQAEQLIVDGFLSLAKD